MFYNLDGSVKRKSVTNLYRLFFERVHVEVILNMLTDPILTGDLEADETWIKAGPKYPGRGRPVSKKYSMVMFTPCGDPRLNDICEVFGIISRSTGKCYSWAVDDRKIATLRPFFLRHSNKHQKINTDGYSGYRFLGREGWRHFYAFHKGRYRFV